MTVVRAVNDGVRFCLELAALAGFAVWGWRTGPDGLGFVLAVAAPVGAAMLWGAFVAPKARRPARDPWRLLLEVAVFGGGALAFAAAGLETSAIVLAIAASSRARPRDGPCRTPPPRPPRAGRGAAARSPRRGAEPS